MIFSWFANAFSLSLAYVILGFDVLSLMILIGKPGFLLKKLRSYGACASEGKEYYPYLL